MTVLLLRHCGHMQVTCDTPTVPLVLECSFCQDSLGSTQSKGCDITREKKRSLALIVHNLSSELGLALGTHRNLLHNPNVSPIQGSKKIDSLISAHDDARRVVYLIMYYEAILSSLS